MGLLRLAVLGSPAVFHDGSRLTFALRKAQALLLYLAVEGGLHPRSKLAALLWPDSEPSDARKNLRNALALLRSLLADDSSAAHSHLLSERELLGLNPRAPLELDLDVVQQAWKEAQGLSTAPAEPQRATLVAHVQAREEVQRLGECVGPYRRFRIVYLRSRALLATWEGHSEQAINHLHEAARQAADLGLPGEQWQIQASLGTLYEAGDEPVQARTAFDEAARIIQGLAEGIRDETLRTHFLAGPQIQPVLQHARGEASQVTKDHEDRSDIPSPCLKPGDSTSPGT